MLASGRAVLALGLGVTFSLWRCTLVAISDPLTQQQKVGCQGGVAKVGLNTLGLLLCTPAVFAGFRPQLLLFPTSCRTTAR